MVCYPLTQSWLDRFSPHLNSRFTMVKVIDKNICLGIPGHVKELVTIQTSNLKLTQKEAWEPPGKEATPRKHCGQRKHTLAWDSHQDHSSESQAIISAGFPHRQLQEPHLQAAGQKQLIYASATNRSLRQCRGRASQWCYFLKNNFS